jgi:hypothetical protein
MGLLWTRAEACTVMDCICNVGASGFFEVVQFSYDGAIVEISCKTITIAIIMNQYTAEGWKLATSCIVIIFKNGVHQLGLCECHAAIFMPFYLDA